jgi:hypothetical protein
MTTRKILSRALVLAALTAFAGAAVANASPSHGQGKKHIVGRVASLSATGFTINGTTLTATSAQLAGLAVGQCVEVKTRLSQGARNVVRITREDRCAPLAPATTTTTNTPAVSSDDPATHDLGDDHGVDPARTVAGGNGGADDALNHDAGDDHGRHGGNHA